MWTCGFITSLILLIGNLGGIVGLFVGISFVTLLEWMYEKPLPWTKIEHWRHQNAAKMFFIIILVLRLEFWARSSALQRSSLCPIIQLSTKMSKRIICFEKERKRKEKWKWIKNKKIKITNLTRIFWRFPLFTIYRYLVTYKPRFLDSTTGSVTVAQSLK